MRIVLEYAEGESLLSLEEVLRRTESAYLKAVVSRIGRRDASAKALGISRKNLWEKLRTFGLSDLPHLPAEIEQAAAALKTSPARVFEKWHGELLKPFTVEA